MHERESIYRATRLNVGRLTTLVKHSKSLSWPSRNQSGGEGFIPAVPSRHYSMFMRCRHFLVFPLGFYTFPFWCFSSWVSAATCSRWPNNPTSVYNFTFLILQNSVLQTFSQLFFRRKWFHEKCKPRWHSCVRSELDLESLERRAEPQREEGYRGSGLEQGWPTKTRIHR